VNNRAGSVGLFQSERRVTLRREPCNSPFAHFYIRYDGSVTPCCATRPDVPEHKDMIMGNVNQDSIFDIYTNFKYCLLRYQMRDFGEKKVFPCSICNDYSRKMSEV
jgi:MoaA/NifB/PqqE/SkfB family radical SAM enzyme